VTALSNHAVVPDPPGRIVGGSVVLEGTDLLGLDEDKMRAIRGNRISMIFQEPMTSLNPVMRIGDQITEAVRLHRTMTRKAASAKAVEMLRLVRIPGRRPESLTSSAVVGSSAISSAGGTPGASRHAALRMPPES